MKLLGTDIEINKNNTPTLSWNIRENDGSPYIIVVPDVTDENLDYFIAFAVSVAKFEQSNRFITTFWLNLSDMPKFTTNQIIVVDSLPLEPVQQVYQLSTDRTYWYFDGGWKMYSFLVTKSFSRDEMNMFPEVNLIYSITIVRLDPEVQPEDGNSLIDDRLWEEELIAPSAFRVTSNLRRLS